MSQKTPILKFTTVMTSKSTWNCHVFLIQSWMSCYSCLPNLGISTWSQFELLRCELHCLNLIVWSTKYMWWWSIETYIERLNKMRSSHDALRTNVGHAENAFKISRFKTLRLTASWIMADLYQREILPHPTVTPRPMTSLICKWQSCPFEAIRMKIGNQYFDRVI